MLELRESTKTSPGRAHCLCTGWPLLLLLLHEQTKRNQWCWPHLSLNFDFSGEGLPLTSTSGSATTFASSNSDILLGGGRWGERTSEGGGMLEKGRGTKRSALSNCIHPLKNKD